MGACISKSTVFDEDQRKVEDILSKRESGYTQEEKEFLGYYLQQYESLLERLSNVITIITGKLKGEDITVEKDKLTENEALPADIAIIKLKNVMGKLKKDVKRLEGEAANYHKLAIEKRSMEDTCKMYLKYEMRCKKASEVISNRMSVIEENLTSMDQATMSLEYVSMMTDVTNSLEVVQKAIGSVEDYQAVMDHMADIDSNLADLDAVVLGNLDVDNDGLDAIFDEINDETEMDEAEITQSAILPEVPLYSPVVPEKDVRPKEKTRVAVMEEM